MDVNEFVVVGASLAGVRAVESARAGGYDGRITLIGGEAHLPYDRPPLSKAVLTAPEVPETTFVTEGNLRDDLGVDLRLGTWAQGIDVTQRYVQTDQGEVPYDALVVATGASARKLGGTDHLSGIHALRTLDDALAVRTALEGAKRVVVIGAGFIGAEVASAAAQRGVGVTIVEAAVTPLVRALGEEMGHACSLLHGRHGVRLICGEHVQRFEGTGHVEAVTLSDGNRLEADLVVVGIGADPATDWLEDSNVGIGDGLLCDAFLATSANRVYAAGDLARWHNPVFDQSMRLENWTSAAEQGRTAAANALSLTVPREYTTVPYYWSDWYGMRLQFVGLPTADETRVVMGSVDSSQWVALYRRHDRLVGALAVNAASVIMKYRRMIGQGASWQEGLDFMSARLAAATHS